MLKPDKTKIKLSFLEVFLSLQTNIGIGEANISQERLIVLANPWFFVMTRHVVPVHSVVVELIENRKTIFRSTSLNGLTIVRLWLANAKQNVRIVQNKTIQGAFITMLSSFYVTYTFEEFEP